MTQQNPVVVPQELLDVFANYGLTVPPLPKNVLPMLVRAGEELFATSALPPSLLQTTTSRFSFAELDRLATGPLFASETDEEETDGEEDSVDDRTAAAEDADGETAPEVPYFLCGFSGRGLQDRAFVYVYASRRLRLGITVSFDCAYADPEAERAELAQALELLTLALQCTREGAALGTESPGTFSWVYGGNATAFEVRNRETVVLTGDDARSLLDYLERCRESEAETAVDARFWIPV